MGLSILGELNLEVAVSVDGELDVELLLGVNWVLVAWTIDAVQLLVGDLEAVTSSVAVAVVALVVWRVALVWS